MTVKALVEKLRTVDQRAEVCIVFDEVSIEFKPGGKEWFETYPYWVRSPVTQVAVRKEKGGSVVELWNDYG